MKCVKIDFNKKRKRKLILNTFIGVEYLAAVALINIYKNKNEKKVELNALNDYGIKAIKKINENHIDAVVLLSSNYTEQLVRDYSDCFFIHEENGQEYLVLKTSIEELNRRFIGYLSLDILKILMSQDILEGLF